jgi:hypothetical protein
MSAVRLAPVARFAVWACAVIAASIAAAVVVAFLFGSG